MQGIEHESARSRSLWKSYLGGGETKKKRGLEIQKKREERNKKRMRKGGIEEEEGNVDKKGALKKVLRNKHKLLRAKSCQGL